MKKSRLFDNLTTSPPAQLSAVTYRNPFVTVELSARQKLILERGRACADFELDDRQAEQFGRVFLLGQSSPTSWPDEDVWEEILCFEHPQEGLQVYF